MMFHFNIVDILKEHNIPFKEKGKNVSKRDVNIKCPFCVNDPSYHCGINKEHGYFYCWRCGTSGSLRKLLKALGIKINFQDFAQKESKKQSEVEKVKEVILPRCFSFIDRPESSLQAKLRKLAISFLKKRNVPLELVVDWYYTPTGYILIPITYKNRVVNYIMRDFLNRTNRYINAPSDKVVIPLSALFYNIDKLQSDIIFLVEGVFDSIKVGLDKSLAMFHKKLTTKQVQLLKDLKVKFVIFLLDRDVSLKDYNTNMDLLNLYGIDYCVCLYDRFKDPAEFDVSYLEKLNKLYREIKDGFEKFRKNWVRIV